MANIWYLGPCRCEEELYLLISEVTPHLDRAGVSFRVPELVCNPASPRQFGEETAKLILKAEGKEFVPVTRGEYLEQALAQGLFPRGTKWDAPLTKADGAVLFLKLRDRMERGWKE